MVPNGWRSCRLGDLFESRREKGRPDLPTMSVTLYDGLVRRDSLDRKTDSNLAAEEHLLVKRGDIAYNMMRMWQGASGLAEFDALVSPAYVVLKPRADIDPLFAAYFFKAARTIYLFWAYSYGLTKDRLRLYFPDFSIIPVVIPPLEEQRRIGQILYTWDRAIVNVERLVEIGAQQKRALTQRLFTGGAKANYPERTVRLSEIAEIIVSNVDKKTRTGEQHIKLCNYTDVYYNDYITADLDFMSATATPQQIKKFSLKKGDILITKDSETPDDIAVPAMVAEDLDGVLCGYHLAILRPRDDVDGAYLRALFSLKSTQHYFFTRANGATRFGLSVSAIEDASFSLPSLEKQRAAARALTACGRSLRMYRDELAKLRREKRALMQQLLTGRRRVRLEEMKGKVAVA